MNASKSTLRIGAGAGFSSDRIEPALALVESGRLDVIVFECLAERTIALAQLRKSRGEAGYDPLLASRMRTILPAAHRNGVQVITNMGAADPQAAMFKTIQIARDLGLHGLRVACVVGDDVSADTLSLRPFDDDPLPEISSMFSANAYLGADCILNALDQNADVIITGRVADPSLFLAPLIHAFGWPERDWNLLGAGIAIGHLLECAGQLTGGYFADPPYKVVPDLANLGFPLAEVSEDGSAVFTKLDGTGGLLNLQTCREQLLYEVMDPARYVTPDVVADFTGICLEQTGENTVRVSGAAGTQRPADFKVSVGTQNGVFGEGQISYAGAGALGRAQLAQNVLSQRLEKLGILGARFDFIGVNSLHGNVAAEACPPYEVRLRVVASFKDAQAASVLHHEVESLYVNGPAGGSGITTSIRESVAIYPALLTRSAVQTTIHMEVA